MKGWKTIAFIFSSFCRMNSEFNRNSLLAVKLSKHISFPKFDLSALDIRGHLQDNL